MLCWKPSRKFFFEFAKVTFFSQKFRESWISWLPNIGSTKDKHGVRESFAKVTILFAKNGRSRIKEFWSTTIYDTYWYKTQPLISCELHQKAKPKKLLRGRAIPGRWAIRTAGALGDDDHDSRPPPWLEFFFVEFPLNPSDDIDKICEGNLFCKNPPWKFGICWELSL